MGTERFRIKVSNTISGQFITAVTGILADHRNRTCEDILVESFTPTFAVFARYIEFHIDSYYGSRGGGLQYLAIRGENIGFTGEYGSFLQGAPPNKNEHEI